MGDRALPRVNKLLQAREIEVRRKRHENRVRRVKSTINNLPPTQYSHLTNQSKKKQAQLERMAKIERENLFLLEKLRRVMVEPQNDPSEPFLKGSLNRDARKREMIKIMEENESLLRRIQTKKPYYSTSELKRDYEHKEKLLANIGEFPYKPDPRTLRKKKHLRRLSAPQQHPEPYRTCVFSQLNININGTTSTLSVYELNNPFRLEFIAMDNERRSNKVPVVLTFELLNDVFGPDNEILLPERTNELVHKLLEVLYFEQYEEAGKTRLKLMCKPFGIEGGGGGGGGDMMMEGENMDGDGDNLPPE